MTAREAANLVAQLKAAYPNANIGGDTIKVYAAALADLDREAAQAAVAKVIATARFFPTIAEIRETVAEAACGLPDAEVAWLEVMDALRRFSDTDRDTWWPEWSHPLIGEALKGIGSLWSLNASNNPGTDRAQFTRIYNSLRRRQVESVAVGALCAPQGSPLQLVGARDKETA